MDENHMHMPRRCASCGGDLVGLGRFPLQKGRYSLLLGHLGNVLHGALEVSALCCVRCGKVEFYLPEDVLAGLLEENTEQSSIARSVPALRRAPRDRRCRLPAMRRETDGMEYLKRR